MEYVHDDRSAEYNNYIVALLSTGQLTDRQNNETATEVKNLLVEVKTRLVRAGTLTLSPGGLLNLQRAINLLGGD